MALFDSASPVIDSYQPSVDNTYSPTTDAVNPDLTPVSSNPISSQAPDVLTKYQLQTAAVGDHLGLGEEVVGGAIATLADIASSIFNSTIGHVTGDVSTTDILSKISQTGLEVYNENPDTIHTLSLIGGMFIPAGAAIKGLSLLRNGSKAVSWFSAAGKEEALANIATQFAKGDQYINDLKAAKTVYYTQNALNAVTDSVAIEAAVFGTMNAHPYMEDYNKDFASNFAFNTVLGAGIGGVVSHIISAGEIRTALAPINKEATSAVIENVRTPDAYQSFGNQVAIRANNISNLEAHLAAANDPANPLELTDFTKQFLDFTIQKQKALLVDNIEAQVSPQVFKTINTPEGSLQDNFINLLKDPKFLEVDHVDFASPSTIGANLKEEKSLLSSSFAFIQKALGTDSNETIAKQDAIYSTIFDGFIPIKQANNYLSAVDLGHTVSSLEAEIKADKAFGYHPDHTMGLTIGADNTAVVDAAYQKATLFASNKNVDELSKLVVSPDDLPLLKAVNNRLAELSRDGEDITKFSLTVTKQQASYDAQMIANAQKAGLSRTYVKDLSDIEADYHDYSLYNGTKLGGGNAARLSGISEQAQEALHRWLGGSYDFLRKGMASIINDKPALHATQKELEAREVLTELINHPNTVAFRNRLLSVADLDGKVWLYRGLRGEPTSQRSIESFTLLPNKAAQFGSGYDKNVKLYKVNVNDIIGQIHDFGEGAMSEILVRPTTREFAQVDSLKLHELPSELLGEDTKTLELAQQPNPNIKPSSNKFNYESLDDHISSTIQQRIVELTNAGYSAETISLRLNLPKESVNQALYGLEPQVLSTYTNKLDVLDALRPENRSLALSANVNKVPTAELVAQGLNMKNQQIGKELTEAILRSSPDPFLKKLGDNLFSDEFRTQLTFIEKDLADFTLGQFSKAGLIFSSADRLLEKFGSTGALLGAVGKQVAQARNTLINDLVTPLTNTLTQTFKIGDHALLEHNTFVNLNAGLSGQRLYKAGQLWSINKNLGSDIQALLELSDDEFVSIAGQAVKKDGLPAATAVRLGEGTNALEFKVVTPEVDAAIRQYQDAGRTMYSFRNAYRQATGQTDLPDIGLWIPAFNPRNKEIAYVIDHTFGKTTLIAARTPEELKASVGAFMSAQGNRPGLRAVYKSEQEDFNKWQGRHDPLYMDIADYTKQKTGSGTFAVPSTGTDIAYDTVQSYETYLAKGLDDLVQVATASTQEQFRLLSGISQRGYTAATNSKVAQLIKQPVDTGQVLRNILLGHSNLSQVSSWAEWQQSGNAIADSLIMGAGKVLSPVLNLASNVPVVGKLFGGKTRTEADWNSLEQKLKQEGIVNPFQVLDNETGLYKPSSELGKAQYLRSYSSGESITPRLLVLGNALAATTLLRVLDLAQPLVNIVALPILSSGAITRRLEASLAGTALDPEAKFAMHSTMSDGMRLWHHPIEGPKWTALAEEKQLFNPGWREVNGLLANLRSFDKGAITGLENAVNSKLVNFLSKPADYSEQFVRQASYFMGVGMAKKAYPGLSDAGVLTFARNFMNQSVGNYTAAQRPVAFQGTFGMAFGLFQTYFLGLAQTMYRQVEQKQWGALGKMLLTQGTIFGGASIPGFHPISEAIGSHFSDQNIDLETGTFRALPQGLASTLLYGLPSQLVGITTRGDIQPRVPDPTNLQTIAAVNLTGQVLDSVDKVAQAAFTHDGNTGRAILEALSLQSVSRPVARLSELGLGYAITQKGQLVADHNDVYTTNGIISRLLATRPIEEIQAREAAHLNSLYGAVDYQKRQALTDRLKTHIRAGSLDENTLGNLSEQYMRTGSAAGWRSAVNKALLEAGQPANASVRDRLSPTSPTMMMINDLG